GEALWERDGRGHVRLGAEDARGVSLARRVLDESGVARPEDVLGAVTEADLELPGQNDDELAPRRRVPVEELPDRPFAERDLSGREPLEPVRLRLEVDLLDVRLLVGAGVQTERPHESIPVSGTLA